MDKEHVGDNISCLPEWNLADLYAGPDDPAVERDLDETLRRAERFEELYRGRIGALDLKPGVLLEAMRELEAISESMDKVLSYAFLLFSGDTGQPQYGAFMQKAQERSTAIRRHLIFFELEWITLADITAEGLLGDSSLSRYRHFLESERRYRPHRLAEGEEKILDDKADTGKRAFMRLFDEILSNLHFSLPSDTGEREAGMEEVLSLLYDGNRETRRAAAESFTHGLEANSRTFTYLFNVLVQDHASDDRLRSYPEPVSSRNLANEIDGETVQVLLDCCRRGYPLVGRYYRLKCRILGLERLYDFDRYAPVLADAGTIPFDGAKGIVLDSFGRFSSRMAEIAGQFFDRKWIDAALRPGKRSGAFSHSTVSSVHPYILLNYTARQRDVMTLAHELGHGVHQCLAAKQGYFHSQTPLTTAETASIFGEMLVFHSMKERETERSARLALVCGKIEDTFATVFRQVAMTTFEERLHQARRTEGELTSQRIGDIWAESNRAMFGDSVELTPGYTGWWMYISHFVHSPFYCYAYAFGELLVLALYRRYLEEGTSFVPRYLALLEAGGSDAPHVLLGRLGVDINDPQFWQGGLALVEEMVAEAESLAD